MKNSFVATEWKYISLNLKNNHFEYYAYPSMFTIYYANTKGYSNNFIIIPSYN